MRILASIRLRSAGKFRFGCLLFAVLPAFAEAGTPTVLPALAGHLVCHYDFDHPLDGDPDGEADLGRSGTALQLVNGGAAMRSDDAAWPGAGRSLQTKQRNPDVRGNDDWKAGIYVAGGVETLGAFNAAAGITIMGWVKPTGQNPGPDSTTPDGTDAFGAIGLFGVLSGTSDGHLVRALVEVIRVDDTLRLVALGRREDAGESLVLVAAGDWTAVLPPNEWTHVAATFDYDNGAMVLYRNGERQRADYAASDDRWKIAGPPEPDRSSATDPAGIKIGGSFPQNSAERNPFTGRFDDLMFFDRVLTADEVKAQFARFEN